MQAAVRPCSQDETREKSSDGDRALEKTEEGLLQDERVEEAASS